MRADHTQEQLLTSFRWQKSSKDVSFIPLESEGTCKGWQNSLLGPLSLVVT